MHSLSTMAELREMRELIKLWGLIELQEWNRIVRIEGTAGFERVEGIGERSPGRSLSTTMSQE